MSALDEVAAVELVPIVTEGDRRLDGSLAAIGGKGLFIKELEHALIENRADIAVHSMKDVPAVPPEGFVFPSVTQREDPRDAIVGARLEALADGARVGTSSLRRQAQLLAVRPDLDIVPVRGNVQTRLGKVESGDVDAVVLATAGLRRLGLDRHITEILPAARMLPAAGQGVVAIECRADREDLVELLGKINDAESYLRADLERAVIRGLGADCRAPVGAYVSRIRDESIRLRALVASPDGRQICRTERRGTARDPAAVAEAAVADLVRDGAKELLAEVLQ